MKKNSRDVWMGLEIVICFMLLFAASGNSQDNRGDINSAMPLKFQVSDASIEMYKLGGYTIGVVADTIILRGTGEGEWTEIRSAQQVHNRYHIRYSAYDFVGLLRIFFVNQFFTFGSTYTGWQSVMDPTSDGIVHTSTGRIVDAGTAKLVVRIENYVKSIVFTRSKDFTRKPACLDSLVQEVEYFTKKYAIIDKDPE